MSETNGHRGRREAEREATALAARVACSGEAHADALHAGDRVFGWLYDPETSLIQRHVVVGADPDLNGGAVAVRVHPYSTGKAAELSALHVTERDENMPEVVKVESIFAYTKRVAQDYASFDVVIERGSAQGSFKAGINIGRWGASATNGLGTSAFGATFGSVVYVDATAWTHGLWGRGAVPGKRERVILVKELFDGMEAMEDALDHLRQPQKEGMADAALITVHKLARARALVAQATFPRAPEGIPPIPMLKKWEETTGLDGPNLYSTLRRDELLKMVRGHCKVRRGACKAELLNLAWDVVARYSDENAD
jgi:hypothetical protein